MLTQEQVDDLVFKLQGRPAKYADKLLANAAFALGVAQEREACAKVCEYETLGSKHQGDVYAEAIRARK
jgi:hypothetical protein